MNELMLTFNGTDCVFDLYDYRCDKYTQEVIVYINVDNLTFIYDVHQSGTGCDAMFLVGASGTDFILTKAVILDIYTYDNFVQVNLNIKDISQYANYGI